MALFLKKWSYVLVSISGNVKQESVLKIFDKKLLGLLVSIIFIILVLNQVDVRKSIETLKSFNVSCLLLAIPVYYFTFLIRGFRWRAILAREESLKVLSLISSTFIGFTTNCLLPARMGDLYRAHLFGKKESIKRLEVLASIVLERIFDGVILFFMLLFSILFIITKPWVYKVAYIAGSFFLSGFIVLLLFAKFKDSKFALWLKKIITTLVFLNYIYNKLPEFIRNVLTKVFCKLNYMLCSFTDGLRIFHSLPLLLKSLFYTLLIWILEGCVTFIIISGFGIKITLLKAIFILCVTVFSTMIPAGPGSIGPYQWGYILAMSLFNISRDAAFAISVVNQFTVLSLISLGGLFFMWKDHINIRELEENIQTEQ